MSTITLISGANQGIGLATAKALARDHGHHVIIGSRNAASGQRVADDLMAQGYAASSIELDLSSDDSINAAAEHIETSFGHLDVLINNAAVLLDTGIKGPENTRKLFAQTMNTNVVGTACLTEAMLPLLRESSLPRIIFVSSIMGSLHESTVKTNMWYPIDYKAYDASKAAVNMLAVEYARILDDVGGKSNAVCPGLNKTSLTGYMEGGTTPEVGATRIVELAVDDRRDGPTATFSNREGSVAW